MATVFGAKLKPVKRKEGGGTESGSEAPAVPSSTASTTGGAAGGGAEGRGQGEKNEGKLQKPILRSASNLDKPVASSSQQDPGSASDAISSPFGPRVARKKSPIPAAATTTATTAGEKESDGNLSSASSSANPFGATLKKKTSSSRHVGGPGSPSSSTTSSIPTAGGAGGGSSSGSPFGERMKRAPSTVTTASSSVTSTAGEGKSTAATTTTTGTPGGPSTVEKKKTPSSTATRPPPSPPPPPASPPPPVAEDAVQEEEEGSTGRASPMVNVTKEDAALGASTTGSSTSPHRQQQVVTTIKTPIPSAIDFSLSASASMISQEPLPERRDPKAWRHYALSRLHGNDYKGDPSLPDYDATVTTLDFPPDVSAVGTQQDYGWTEEKSAATIVSTADIQSLVPFPEEADLIRATLPSLRAAEKKATALLHHIQREVGLQLQEAGVSYTATTLDNLESQLKNEMESRSGFAQRRQLSYGVGAGGVASPQGGEVTSPEQEGRGSRGPYWRYAEQHEQMQTYSDHFAKRARGLDGIKTSATERHRAFEAMDKALNDQAEELRLRLENASLMKKPAEKTSVSGISAAARYGVNPNHASRTGGGKS